MIAFDFLETKEKKYFKEMEETELYKVFKYKYKDYFVEIAIPIDPTTEVHMYWHFHRIDSNGGLEVKGYKDTPTWFQELLKEAKKKEEKRRRIPDLFKEKTL